MRHTWMLLAVVTFGVLALTAIRVGAQAVQPSSDIYSWSGEFVAFDANARTITVKSQVAGDEALRELPQFKSGDRLILTWSGFDTFADAISRAVRYDASKKWWYAPFTFPAEFVAYESRSRHLTFKVRVPASNAEAVKSVEPGEWVTATARHRPTSAADAIAAVNVYRPSAVGSIAN